ncbi:MAG: bifunctional phosphopantothenoylcysteine decarboxylase/phosphopantothenate--cysteine ligase CoaBC [Deltaproteobacteria bacterium]|nr:bifunctional phosphopantothenoylcysteine decarboxylase/phosphopantothenate--cysteine ligase CoaBC [Deltaproteobacteria bacterium]
MKNILLAVTGGIAAYKTPSLVRLFKKDGYDVRVVVTENALELVSENALATVSQNPVRKNIFEISPNSVDHIDVARWADLIIVAPATANTIAKYACGIADNLLTTILMAAKCPVLIAPGMNDNMWDHEATKNNVSILRKRGIFFSGPEEGELACGTSGTGRMSQPETILNCAASILSVPKKMNGLKILITAGATREYFDPARFLSNPSSGRMGAAMAFSAKKLGGDVTVFKGFMEVPLPSDCRIEDFVSADDLYKKVIGSFHEYDIVVMAAAVSDWTFSEKFQEKQKKSKTDSRELQFNMKRTMDILQSISENRIEKPRFIVGFAAETATGDELIRLGQEKLEKKRCDLIIANDVSGISGAFRSTENEVVMIWPDGTAAVLEKASKTLIAEQIWERILEKID